MSAGVATSSPPIRLLVLAGGWPRRDEETEAADVVLYELLRCLAEDGAFELWMQCVGRPDRVMPPPLSRHMDALSALGVGFLDPVSADPVRRQGKLGLLGGVLAGRPERLIEGAGLEAVLAPTLERVRPQAVLTVWNEFANAIAAGLALPLVAYYGDADPVIHLAGMDFDWRSREGRKGLRDWAAMARRMLVWWGSRRAHFRLMRRLAAVCTVSANIADYYRAEGVRARYVRNLWRAESPTDWSARRDRDEQVRPLKVVGSLGSLRQTANGYGLELLAHEVVPALRRRLGADGFEMHIYGRGEPLPHVGRLLGDPNLRRRGFVDDLDAEILSAPVFVVANNRSWFKVGHTRFLHAWSLGACVVAFRDSALTMPELVHDENALLADGVEEMADLIVRAAGDKALRRRLGAGGIATLERYFRPEAVAAELAGELQAAVGRAT